jgi:uncharacterized protein YcgL (UPF0745 family)
MLCTIYKSSKKAETYLFVKQRDDFSAVPAPLMSIFGTPTLVTVMNLENKEKLAISDINKVKENLNGQGFYLQLPPPKENLLDQHKEEMQLKKSIEG